ncbi:Trans-aconitate 2-methyltransferase [Pandoraea terrae]|uniref:Trans-aconitate 2-methyltransferase n=1 Tax=Pandoraea terrae TaxID=1537710 RepID=A0A5E4U2P3_9BURK|nr:class I SAM-dependent methyltransferase [Pandoraea terrae]VVD93991.1 Trans-aconitate 2-methyltransferase [Pandoraea terrae]
MDPTIWQTPTAYAELSRALQRRNAQLLATLACQHNPAPMRILDACCGTGSLLATLGDKAPGAHRVGIDVSPHMIAEARNRLYGEDCDLRVGDIMTHDEAASYDLVISNAALHWFSDNVEATVKQLARLLVPGGVLAVATAGLCDDAVAFDHALHEVLTGEAGESPFSRRRVTVIELQRAAGRAGLQPIDLFALTRHEVVDSESFVDWLCASGLDLGLGLSAHPRFVDAAKHRVRTRFGPLLRVGHWSSVGLFRNTAGVN